MMSGELWWANGYPGNIGVNGRSWASTPYSYAVTRYLGFASTNVNPRSGDYKPYGMTLRCVARNPQKPHSYSTSITFRNFPPRSKFLFPALFLPELSAASLFRLCCRAISTGAMVFSAIEVRMATSGHLRLTPTPIHSAWSSAPLTFTLGMAAISCTAWPSAASPVFLSLHSFQSSPQPPSSGYDVGRFQLVQ